MSLLSSLTTDEQFQIWRHNYTYPQSHMRNLARKAALTAFTFVADVDILPSPGFAHALRTALPRIAEMLNLAQQMTLQAGGDSGPLPFSSTTFLWQDSIVPSRRLPSRQLPSRAFRR